MCKLYKKSQITIFVIIALAIIGVLIFLFYPQIKGFIITTPESLIPVKCIESNINRAINYTLNPKNYYLYENQKVDYLCYTSEWYKTCQMQKPFLKQEVETEILKNSSLEIEKCMNKMIEKLKNKGYNVEVNGKAMPEINIVPKKVIVSFNRSIAIEKGEEKSIISSSRLQTEVKSNVYEMLMVASSIQNFEARYGDSVPEEYMGFYPNLKIEKKRQEGGTKIYVITDRETNEKLVFAIRSLAWPPGFANPDTIS
jgi:hypothetical protein